MTTKPIRSLKPGFVFFAVSVVLVPVGYWAMFSSFHAYDDEGYFLVVLRDYLAGQPLLRPAAPIYGPFFFEVMGGVFKLFHLQPGHDSGRLVTLAIWLTGSLGSGLAAFRLTKNLWLGAGVVLMTFGVLEALVNEPMQPSGLISLLLVGLVAAAAYRSARPRLTATLIGAMVGGLLLIKINVGAFAALAVVFAWSASLGERGRRFALPLVALLVAAAPLALTYSLLARGWVLEFAVVMTAAAVAVGIACVVSPPSRLSPASTVWLVAGGVVVMLVTLGVAVAGGTRPLDVWNGLVVVSVRFPQVFAVPLTISPGYDGWAGVAVIAALVLLGRWRGRALPRAAGLGRVAAGFFTWLTLLLPPGTTFLLALPLVWIATQAPSEDADSPSDPYARLLLPALAVLDGLQAYPVAGTQLSLASLVLVPAGAIILGDGIRQLRGQGEAVRLVRWVAPAAVVFNVAVFVLFAITADAAFAGGAPLGLPGAASPRLQAQTVADLRGLVAALDEGCASFITLPGMDSFYMWTGEDPPSDVLRSEIWWLTAEAAQQQSLVQQLEGTPRLCVVRNQRLIDFWAEGRPVPDRPLVQFIDSSFTSVGTFGDYELLRR